MKMKSKAETKKKIEIKKKIETPRSEAGMKTIHLPDFVKIDPETVTEFRVSGNRCSVVLKNGMRLIFNKGAQG